jgi:hypothetical protein
MSGSFAEVASSIAVPFAQREDVRGALEVLGAEAGAMLHALPFPRRAALVDRFVRNLRSISVHDSPQVHRLLMSAADAGVEPEFHIQLADARSVLAVRNHLKAVMTSLGHSWEALSRVQAGVCGVIRWLQSSAGAEIWISSTDETARFTVGVGRLEADPRMIESSPMVMALKSAVQRFQITRRGSDLHLEFEIHRVKETPHAHAP